MTPDPTNPRQALEASLTALLLGELPPDQAAFLRQAIATDPELARMYARLERTINLVRETAAEPAPQPAAHTQPLRLSSERREQLLQRFKTVNHPALAKPEPRTTSWLISTAIAATLMLLVGALAMMVLTTNKRSSLGETEELRALKPKVKAVDMPREVAEADKYRFTLGLNRNSQWATDSFRAAPPPNQGAEQAGHPLIAGQAGAPASPATTPPQTTIFLPPKLPESESQLALTAKAPEGSFSGGGIGGGGGGGVAASPNLRKSEPALAEPNQNVSSYGIASEDRSKMRYALAGEAAAARAGAPLPQEAKQRFGGRAGDWAPSDAKDRLPAAGTEIYRGVSVMTNGRIEMQPVSPDSTPHAGKALLADNTSRQLSDLDSMSESHGTKPTLGDLPSLGASFKEAPPQQKQDMALAQGGGEKITREALREIEPSREAAKDTERIGSIRATNLQQLIKEYAELTGKTVLQPATLPNPAVKLEMDSSLSRTDAVESLKAALRVNGLAVEDFGERFAKVVPSANSGQLGAPISPPTMSAATDPTTGLPLADAAPSVDPTTGLPLPQRSATGPLVTRVIKVDPTTFKQGLEGVIGFDWGSIAQSSSGGGGLGGGALGGGTGGGLLLVPRVNVAGGTGTVPSPGGGGGVSALQRTNDQVNLQALTRQFFLTMGLDLNPRDGKSLFYDDRAGTLVVRARPSDLDTIEQAVAVMQSEQGTTSGKSNALTAELRGFYDDSKATPTELADVGKRLFMEGNRDEAEAKFKEAVKKDPQNQRAYYYLNQIAEAKFQDALNKRDVASSNGLVGIEKAWATPSASTNAPQPNLYARTNLLAQNRGKQIVYSKLNRIRLDSVRFENLPLREVVTRLSEEVRKRDPEKRGVNLDITEGEKAKLPEGAQRIDPATGLPLKNEAVDVGDVTVSLPVELKDITLGEALDAVVKTADRPIKYSVGNDGVVFSPVTPANTADDAAQKPVATTPPPEPQPEIQTHDNAFSTFSLNVSDVSFKLAAASLEKGVLPEPASIRSEEFINAFDYRDPEPAPGAPIAFAWERARYPFAQNRDLLRFSLKTAALGRQAGRPLNLVLLLDNSGSMERADRVSIIREALRVLATQLQPNDTLSVVLFARTPRLWVDGVPGNQAGKVADELSGLTPEGGTNLGDALDLAYQTALRHYLPAGINRVVLLTDGAANLGNVEPEELKKKVEANRRQGVALDCFGIGWEGYNDDLLEVLTRNGDGRYGFINTPEEAATEFAGQLAGALHVAASDVKVQVEFNPKRVTAYRQIGYAKHQLTKEQFRDNSVDAAELGAAESGNALYVVDVNGGGDGPLATVRVRYKVPGTMQYQEHEWTVPYTGNAVPLEQASPALRLAASASAFSEWLATSPYAAEVTPDSLLGYLRGVPEICGADARPKKLEWMIRQAKSLVGK